MERKTTDRTFQKMKLQWNYMNKVATANFEKQKQKENKQNKTKNSLLVVKNYWIRSKNIEKKNK